MSLGLKIAIGGKGGVGKTTVCAVWAELFARDGAEVLAIDADSDANLASAFGIRAEESPQPLILVQVFLTTLHRITKRRNLGA